LGTVSVMSLRVGRNGQKLPAGRSSCGIGVKRAGFGVTDRKLAFKVGSIFSAFVSRVCIVLS